MILIMPSTVINLIKVQTNSTCDEKKDFDLPKYREIVSFTKGWPLARAMANSHTLGEAGLDLPPPTLRIIYNHLPTIPPLSIQLSKQCTCKYFLKYIYSINTHLPTTLKST